MEPLSGNGVQAPADVEVHASEWFHAAHLIVGDRFAESRFDPDRGLRVTVIDLTDNDVAAVTKISQRLGIAGWVRLERADPTDLAEWERLRHDLIRLAAEQSGVLQSYPTPNPGYRRRPVEIHLAADAEVAASELHARYGDFVSLRVGALPYPTDPAHVTQVRPRDGAETLMDSTELRVALDGPLSVRSGKTTAHQLLLANLSYHTVSVNTNGMLTATIVNGDTGERVGGYTGGRRLPLHIFTVAPAETVRIPLLVGTASSKPELGYAIPPGTWHLTATLRLDDGRRLVTPPLEITVTGLGDPRWTR